MGQEVRRQTKKGPDRRKERFEAWVVFSKYIRLRDCMRTTKTKTRGFCVSCGKPLLVRDGDRWLGGAQAGHFIPGRSNAVLFHPRLVHLQCLSCNVYRGGNWVGYLENLVKRWGVGEVTRLLALRHSVVKYIDYTEIKEKYKKKFARLERLRWDGERWRRG